MADDHDFLDKQKAIAFKKWFYGYIKQSWWRIAVLVVIALTSVGLSLLDPWPLKIVVDSVFGKIPAPGFLARFTGTTKLLYLTGIIYVIIYILQSFLAIINGYLGTRFGFKLDINVKSRVFKHILYLPYKATNRLETGDYIYRENVETGTLSATVLGSFISIFGSIITVIGIFTILFFLYWQLAALILLVLPFMIISMRLFGGKIQAKSKKLEENTSEVYVHVQESVENADVVQAFDRQEGQHQKLVDLLNKKLKTQLSFNLLMGAFGLVTSTVTVCVIVVIFLVGGRGVFDGRLSLGELLIFINYAGLLYTPLGTIASAFAATSQNFASLHRVFEIVHDHANLEDTSVGESLGRAKGEIIFKNVNLSYHNKTVLKDINLSIKPGEKIAFIGPSGAGKSSILDLIIRFVIPDSGFVYIDGREIHSINLDSLRQNIAIVDQEPKLFSISVADNIAFSEQPNEKYPLPGIIGAAHMAYVTEFIDQLPKKYDQLIEQSGGSLSGGQKQRIAIARAIYKEAPILLLDEPTSAQDASSEKHLLDAINGLIKNRTVLMVSHKLSLLSQMDRVYVVEGGSVQDVKNYGGLDAYARYKEVHENS